GRKWGVIAGNAATSARFWDFVSSLAEFSLYCYTDDDTIERPASVCTAFHSRYVDACTRQKNAW
ncbi:MAG: hypothetical protein M3Y56_05455, partial [Armatimonadota bacterium]|nr:hypothetical protein [Armatimonadota bacterium]